MALANISPRTEDFEQCEWQDVIAGSEKKQCDAYAQLFGAKARELEEQGDTKAQQVFELLFHVCSLILRPDSPHEPFIPMATFPDRRSAAIDDFSDGQLKTLEAIVPTLEDPELQARIADILWYKKKSNYQIAEIAVKSYLKAAQVLEDPQDWIHSADRIERAVQLAASLGKDNKLFAEVISFIEDVLDKYQGEDPLFLSGKLMEILQEYGQGDPAKYAALAEKAALRAEAAKVETPADEIKWHISRTYWQIKAQWHAMNEDAENRRLSQIRAAETYVKEAEDALRRPSLSYTVAASFLQQAIEALRRIRDTQDRRQELHKKLLEYQKKSVAEFETDSYSLDIGQYVQKATDMVKDKTLRDALLALALSASSRKVSDLRKRVEEYASKFMFTYIVPTQILDEKGKIKGRRPSMYGAQTESEEALQAEMFRLAARDQSLFAQAVVMPAIAQINIEHNVRLIDLLPFVSNNPFVPPGREYIFARGLYAGLTGDFLVAAHLLVFQIEHSIRYLLEQTGVIVSGLSDQRIQDEYTLNKLLDEYKSELTEVFGEDLVFDLRGLLIERFGSNLRNLVAHGLMDHLEFQSWKALYLWWLTLRLCCLPIYAQTYASRDTTQEQPENASSHGEEDD